MTLSRVPSKKPKRKNSSSKPIIASNNSETSTRVKATSVKQINTIVEPCCVKLVDLSAIINLKENPFTTKLFNETALVRLKNMETNFLCGKRMDSPFTDYTTTIDYSHKFESLKKCLKSPKKQVLYYDRLHDEKNIDNESMYNDEV